MPTSITLEWDEYLELKNAAVGNDPRVVELERQLSEMAHDYAVVTAEAEYARAELSDTMHAFNDLKQSIGDLRDAHVTLKENHQLMTARAMAREQELAELDELRKTNERQAEELAKQADIIKSLLQPTPITPVTFPEPSRVTYPPASGPGWTTQPNTTFDYK